MRGASQSKQKIERGCTAKPSGGQERGQMLIMLAMISTTLFGLFALVIDVGRTYLTFHQLLASTDAAALAGGEALGQAGSTSSSTATAVNSYSSLAGGLNVYRNMSGVSITTTLKCLSTLANAGTPCYGAGSYNAVQVTQNVSMPTTFAATFGMTAVPVSFTATAAMAGAATTPYNVAIILDATLSQTSQDDNCGTTEMTCEMNGVKVLLQSLLPCAASMTSCSFSNGMAENSVDRVSLFTFPALSMGTVSIDSSCTTPIPSPTVPNGYKYNPIFGNYVMMPTTPWFGVPSAVPYSFPTVGATSYAPASSPTSNPTYQVTGFVSDYRTSNTATTLNPNSALVKALGGVNGCGGMLPANYDGDIGTYYAGVLYAAQAALTAELTAYPGSQNVIILLSDGDANSPQTLISNGVTVHPMPTPATLSGTYPSWINECAQAVTAAQYATNQGTKVYSIAYGAEAIGCISDLLLISPCQTMQNIASSPSYFFSDYAQSGSININCVGTGATTTNLQQIFTDIYTSFTVARLIPNETT
jgi:hypothetical protein